MAQPTKHACRAPARLLSLAARLLLLLGMAQLGKTAIGGILDEATAWAGRSLLVKLLLILGAPLMVGGFAVW